jgi:hypothetical protein
MFSGGPIARFFGVNAERRPLEDIATPLLALPASGAPPERVRLAG